MTDLERIEEIEKIIGFKLDRVEPDEFRCDSYMYRRRYCVDEYGNVTMLSFLDVPVNLIPGDLLSGFRKLRYLNLSDCRNFDPDLIIANNDLFSLNLTNTKLGDYTFLKNQKSLVFLNLNLNNISDISILNKLKSLTLLDLSDNKISDINILKELNALTLLWLNNNEISDISILKELKSLTSLDLKGNKISDISILKELKALTLLTLRGNQISDISILKELKSLTSLDLGNNKISDISILKDLKSLTSLVLWDNKISDISILKELNALTSLWLNNNEISDISILKELKSLTALDLSTNQISDISIIKELKALTSLDLRDNLISDISILKELKNLASLNLANNQIAEIPEWLTEKGLEIKIENKYNYNCINLYGNPIQTPPIEIAKQGNEAIRQWYTANRKKLNEIKVLLVGEAKAGKTSLMRRLFDKSYNPQEQQTDGITIEKFNFTELDTFKNQKQLHGITAYFWDFGGQEIMSSTHQFFMTKRSLYILVLEARKDEKSDEQVRTWMRRIRSFGGESQVIIVVNKIDQNPAFRLDEYTLRKEYPQIKDILRVSCATPENCDAVKIAIEEYIPKTELFNTEIDERWFPVKSELQKRTSKRLYLAQREFETICSDNGLIEESEQLSAVRFLNDLGMVLHFDNLKLSEFYVLDPYWVTSGVYRIITSDISAKQNGVVEVEQLRSIINDYKEESDTYTANTDQHIKYSPSEVLYIADIMAEFKLCFYMDNNTRILIPDLLDKNTPATEYEPFLNASGKIAIIYSYEYLPNTVLPRLIVEMRNDIKTVWRTGLVLNCKGCIDAQALVYTGENRIQIIVTGEHKQKREYMSVLRYLINTINRDFSVTTSVLIPLPGTDNLTVEFEELLAMEQAGQKKYLLYKLKKEWEICDLLDGIATDEEIQKETSAIIKNYTAQSSQKSTYNQNGPRTVRLFLASSSELKEHREEFEKFINRQNNHYIESQNIYLKLEHWEDFIDAMDKIRLQNAYNRTIREGHIFVMLYWTKVGKYTAEEFEVAFGQFKETNRPLVYTYECTEPVPNDKLKRHDTNSLFDFRDKLKDLGHFPTQYTNIDNLEKHFGLQLQKIIPEIVAS